MKEIKIKVKGMVCGGCEKRIINALNDISGVSQVMANHNDGIVTIMADEGIKEDEIKEKIDDIGFEVEEN